jgi:5-formyltetrahydrofolate cyclo-ligase
LAALRSRGAVTAVGVGFAVQQVDAVPRSANDERLDWILTEEMLMQVRA